MQRQRLQLRRRQTKVAAVTETVRGCSCVGGRDRGCSGDRGRDRSCSCVRSLDRSCSCVSKPEIHSCADNHKRIINVTAEW